MTNVDTFVSVAETNLPLLVEETGVAVTAVAFTSDASNGDTETLVITPRGPCHKMVVIINEVGSVGTMTVNCEAGSFWAGQAMDEVDVESGKSVAFVFEAAKHYGNEGLGSEAADEAKIQISVAPDTGKKLVTHHGATWQVFQLP
jgi:hypothetical protein